MAAKISSGVPASWYRSRLGAMPAKEICWRAAAPMRRALAPGQLSLPRWNSSPWKEFVEAIVTDCPGRFVEDAALIADGHLSFWGQPVLIAEPAHPQWQADPIEGGQLSQARRDWHRDLKPIWELHRQQHLFPLAAGARIQEQRGWAEVCVTQLLDWIAHNPSGTKGRNPGWTSGYETAHRLIGWALTVPLLLDHLSPSRLDAISRSYAAQAAFTRADPSRFSSANNHRLAEIVGMLAAASVDVDETAWSDLWAELENEVDLQTFVDGGSREQAGGYFLYVLEMLWFAGLMAHARTAPLGRIEVMLKTMLSWLERVADVEGEPPPVGDDAEDRIVRVDYFERRSGTVIAARVRSLLEGRNPLAVERAHAARAGSTVLAASGYGVLRGRSPLGEVRVVLDMGPLGFGPLAAHGHADALSVLLDVGQEPVLRDSGTYSYSPAADERDALRRTAAHNTISVDGQDQAEMLGPHLWGARYRVNLQARHLGAELDYLRASHDGYTRLPARAVHTRSVLYLRPALLIVLDRIVAERTCSATLAWHLHPDGQPVRLLPGGGGMVVCSNCSLRESAGDVPYSSRYGTLAGAPRLAWTAEGSTVVFATVIDLEPDRRSEATLFVEDGAAMLSVTGADSLSIHEDWEGALPIIRRACAA